MKRIHIANGHLIDPANRIDGKHDVYIAEGRVLSIDVAPDGFEADTTIDAHGHIVCPGLVDLRVHLREPGEEHKATIASETRAAVSGGITTLCCPPTTIPVIDTPAVDTLIRRRAKDCGLSHVVTLGAMTQNLDGTHLSEMAALKSAGCVGISNDRRKLKNNRIRRRAFEYAATFGLKVFLHPEDSGLADDGCMHEGIISTRLGLPGIPESAETVALARDLILIEETGVSAHFCQLSSGRAIGMIADAQKRGLAVSADVAAHHLYLSEHDVGYFNSSCHVLPPLRTLRDQSLLQQGTARGTIGAICSGHAPHEADAKLAPFNETSPGISGLETLLPLCLRLHHDLGVSLSDILAKLTSTPARILGLDRGQLGVGAIADICIFDPEQRWVFNKEEMLSAGKNTPFSGWEFKGKVQHCLVNGKIVYSLS